MSHHSKPYDNILDAWLYTLGDDFYFGYFDSEVLRLPAAVKNMYRHLMTMAGITSSTRVLTVGWGIGELELYLYENYGCNIWRVYHDPLRIETAQQRCLEKSYDQHIHFHIADSLIGHFPDSYFDVVLAFESSVFFNDKSSFMSDSWRILRNGGRMVFADTMLMKELTLADIFYTCQKEMLVLERTWGRMKMESLDSYRNKMKESRFREVVAHDISPQVLPTLAKWKETATANQQQLLEVLDREKLEDFLISCDIMQRFFNENFYCYGIITGVKGSNGQ